MRLDLDAMLGARWLRAGTPGVATTLAASLVDLLGRAARERRRDVARFLGVDGKVGARWARRLGAAGRLDERPGGESGYSLELGERTMNGLRSLGLAVRSLMRRPGFTAVATLTMGVGLGSVVAIFTIVNAVLLQPLPYADGDRIVNIEHHAPGIDLPTLSNSPGTLSMYLEEADFISPLAGVSGARRVLTGLDSPTRIDLLQVTEQFFEVMATVPAMGRPLVASDNLDGAAPVVVLTQEFWATRLGADPDVVGTTLELDGVSTEVVGVLPADFEFVQPGPVGIVPLGPLDPQNFGTFGLNGVGRLVEGVSVEQAQVRLETLQARIPERFPDIDAGFLESAGWAVSVTRMRDDLVDDVATTLWLVLGTVGFVLLIAWANVANLFLVRAESRQKEIAVRVALGAGRTQVAASFLNEALVVGVMGGLLGIVVSQLGVGALMGVAADSLPRAGEVALTPSVLGFTALLSIGSGVLLGLLPLTRFSSSATSGVLRDGYRGSTAGRGRVRLRGVLVVGQLGLAMVLVVGSGLMFRSFAALRQVDAGFEPSGVLAMEVSVGEGMTIPEAAAFYGAVADQARAIPGVTETAVVTQAPLMSGTMNGGSFRIQSRPEEEHTLPPVGYYRGASPEYFSTMGIPLLEGREMTAADLDGSTRAVWVDQSFASTHFPESEFPDGVVGEFITWDGQLVEAGAEDIPWLEVAGIVGDTKYMSIREDETANAYLPLRTGDIGYPALNTATVLVKSAVGDGSALAPELRDIVTSLNGSVPVTRIQSMDSAVREALAGDSITLVILGIAAGMALFLGAVGLYGVISYVVSQRTREIGVRMALGAHRSQVSQMVLRQGIGVAAAGVTLGLLGAFGLTRVMGSILYESVSATDPATFVLAPVLLLAVSALAMWVPARRAAQVDPMRSLRDE
jgi:predicted permease